MKTADTRQPSPAAATTATSESHTHEAAHTPGILSRILDSVCGYFVYEGSHAQKMVESRSYYV